MDDDNYSDEDFEGSQKNKQMATVIKPFKEESNDLGWEDRPIESKGSYQLPEEIQQIPLTLESDKPAPPDPLVNFVPVVSIPLEPQASISREPIEPPKAQQE